MTSIPLAGGQTISSCSPGYYCTTYSIPVRCSDIVFTANPGVQDPNNVAGTYALVGERLQWQPVYIKYDQNGNPINVAVYNSLCWSITNYATFTSILEQSTVCSGSATNILAMCMSSANQVYPPNFKTFTTTAANQVWVSSTSWSNGFTMSYSQLPSRFGNYCPGSQVAIPGPSGQSFYYGAPFLRQCVTGFFCPDSMTQLWCQDLVVTFNSNKQTSITFTLTTNIINNYPIYTSPANGFFWYNSANGNWALSGQSYLSGALKSPPVIPSTVLDYSLGNDPKIGWSSLTAGFPNSASSANNNNIIACPPGSRVPVVGSSIIKAGILVLTSFPQYALSIENGNAINNGQVWMWSITRDHNQVWQFLENGLLVLQAFPNYALTAIMNPTGAPTTVCMMQVTNPPATNQMWSIDMDGFVHLQSIMDYGLTVAAGGVSDYGIVSMAYVTNGNLQLWSWD